MAMTGPEHYRHAARLAGEAYKRLSAGDEQAAAAWAAAAQAHATLASTAAIIGVQFGLSFATEEAWREALGAVPPGPPPVIEGTAEHHETGQ